MTTRERSHRTPRRLAAVAAALVSLAAVAVAIAGPALADAPANGEDAPHQDPIRSILILAGIPILLAVVIGLFVYLPAIARGEQVKPGSAPVQDQWLGGPRRAAGELAGPDTETSEAGGAGARW